MVGAERSDELADARQMVVKGHRVTVVNPRETAAVASFVRQGGTFVRKTIQRLPSNLGPFDLICENYPYTVARVAGVCDEEPCPIWLSTREARAYATARLKHLAPNGRWVLFTESSGLTCALRSIGRSDHVIRRNFTIRAVRLTDRQSPPSIYPHLATRFKLTFQRFPVKRSWPKSRLTKTSHL